MGVGEFFRTWWRQPHEFDWIARHFRARGLLRVHQVFIGCFSLLYGLTALLSVVWAYYDGGSVGGRVLVLSIAASSAVLGVVWIFGSWPTERQSIAFAVYADVAVVVVMGCYQDAFTAMPGLALLAANGIYIVIVHGPRALVLHLGFTAAVFAVTYGIAIAQGAAPVSVITVRLLVLMPTVIALPVIVQSYLLALRMDAVDSLHDPLTRLYNRRGLDTHLADLVAPGGTQVGVLAVDIDKFKAINDRYGHDTGDRVLVAVADAARAAVSARGVRSATARTGGEEFVIVVDGGPELVVEIAATLHDLVTRCDTPQAPTVSIGAATSRIDDDLDVVVRALIERADAAMYRAKQAGGNRTVTVDDAVPAQD
ncbi:GGDEF domain-containing protein [Mycobacterium sp. ITM-2016-00317]|uniref:GGDEF domain-containing protein n=1 Tax=Mycobacterium sp. ITM-2016-00317 TaxID=2099694 RepID=UPI00287F6B24|nr:GGDEF domain-containing protein [Mycobacterium sp. ITM-2016-00317]WNG88219.1 GGDEF domain-containing protein [Mycobacterium sp. ITM-2016-00317]